ncbi:hypothetical protein [Nostoc sp.]|uniref:hypothetical protein n=1 Tax=Nostoc sp. TaxID=1180 RepID=UPI002FFD541C
MFRSQSATGNAVLEAEPLEKRQSRQEQHFQPEALNEVLKGFALKLTPMSIAVPLLRGAGMILISDRSDDCVGDAIA